MFEPEVFRKQMYCIDNSAFDIVGTFGAPAETRRSVVIWRTGNCATLLSSLRP